MTKLCCENCNKEYTRKYSLDKHKILCDFKIRTKRQDQIDNEELGDTPTHYQLVKIVQELTLKMTKMEEKMEQMQKWVDKTKKKINVLEWLNWTNIKIVRLSVSTKSPLEKPFFHSLMRGIANDFFRPIPPRTLFYPTMACLAV